MTSLARPTASRALHLRILPRPTNLGESREILRLLSQFGEIEYFKNLKYDTLSSPNTALVIFKSKEAAEACAHKSHMRFRMGKAAAPVERERESESRNSNGGSGGGVTATTTTTTTTTPPPPPPPRPHPRPNSTPFEAPPLPILESRIYQIESNFARAHFRDQINAGRYHGGFSLDTKRIAQKELVKVVPVPGLSCVNWKVDDRAWRLVRRDKESEQSGPGRRRNLREIYEEGGKV